MPIDKKDLSKPHFNLKSHHDPGTAQAIDWARQAIGCLLWGEPPVTELDPQKLESILPVLQQMRATLKPELASKLPKCHANHRHITDHWSEQATIAIDALIEFRSICHRWHAGGQIVCDELLAIAERLELARLGAWFDHIVCVALVAQMIEKDFDEKIIDE